VSDIEKKHHTVRAGRDAVSAVQLSQSLTAAIDAWAEARHLNRSDAIRQLIELGLKAMPAPSMHRMVQQHSGEIEDEAISRIRAMLDPSLSAEERERRIRRLIEGPPEFADQRIDLPKHEK
jgi:Arc/MetJ-type ribon-helix-helix transcriptional regulator